MIDPQSAIITIVISFFGAFFAFVFQRIFGREQRRQELTQKFIDELLGPHFFPHVVTVSKVRREYLESEEPKVFIQNVAAGYWFPGAKPYYIGATTNGLTDHEHIELAIRFSSRLCDAIKSNMLNNKRIKDTIADDFHWTHNFLREIAEEVKRQRAIAEEKGSQTEAKWVNDINFLGDFFGYRYSLSAEKLSIKDFR